MVYEMPKNPVELLKRELRKRQFELLDVYSFRDYDVLRVLSKPRNKVLLYKSSRKINTIASSREIEEFASTIVKQLSQA